MSRQLMKTIGVSLTRFLYAAMFVVACTVEAADGDKSGGNGDADQTTQRPKLAQGAGTSNGQWQTGTLLEYRYTGASGRCWTHHKVEKVTGGVVRLTIEGCDGAPNSWDLYWRCPAISTDELPLFTGQYISNYEDGSKAKVQTLLATINQAGEKHCKAGSRKAVFEDEFIESVFSLNR